MKIRMLAAACAAAAFAYGAAPVAQAADDTIVLGAAVSLTGKYSTNGKNTKDGYDLAVKTIKNQRTKLKTDGLIRIIAVNDENGQVDHWIVARTKAPRDTPNLQLAA